MQLGRSYSRRLKKMKYEIYELYPSARHAYQTMKPAVKTSRPHSKIKELLDGKDTLKTYLCRPKKNCKKYSKCQLPSQS
jgi:hypothetical protein